MLCFLCDVFHASKLFFCCASELLLLFDSLHTFPFHIKTALIGIQAYPDCVTYWLGFELREQKSILFILLLLKKTNPNNERFEAKYKIFLVCSFLLSRSPTVKEARRNRRWQSTTKNLSSVRFFFSILHSLENYFHISRKISHSHIFYALSYHCSADVQNKTKL